LPILVDKTEHRHIEWYSDAYLTGIQNILQIGRGRGNDAKAAQ
jgi:hypothetical protein